MWDALFLPIPQFANTDGFQKKIIACLEFVGKLIHGIVCILSGGKLIFLEYHVIGAFLCKQEKQQPLSPSHSGEEQEIESTSVVSSDKALEISLPSEKPSLSSQSQTQSPSTSWWGDVKQKGAQCVGYMKEKIEVVSRAVRSYFGWEEAAKALQAPDDELMPEEEKQAAAHLVEEGKCVDTTHEILQSVDMTQILQWLMEKLAAKGNSLQDEKKHDYFAVRSHAVGKMYYQLLMEEKSDCCNVNRKTVAMDELDRIIQDTQDSDKTLHLLLQSLKRVLTEALKEGKLTNTAIRNFEEILKVSPLNHCILDMMHSRCHANGGE